MENFDEVLKDWLVEASKITDNKLEAMEGGKKYIRITRDGGTSVYCFVDKSNGDLLFPAGWNAPTKHKPVRGNIFRGTEGVEKYSLKYLR